MIKYQGPMTFNSLSIDIKESATFNTLHLPKSVSHTSSQNINLNLITDIFLNLVTFILTFHSIK